MNLPDLKVGVSISKKMLDIKNSGRKVVRLLSILKMEERLSSLCLKAEVSEPFCV